MSRPLNAGITFVSVWIAAFISPKFYLNSKLILGGFVAAFIAAGANIVNDIFDREIDRINKPQRALPSGTVSVREAWTYFTLLYGVALLLSVFCNRLMLVIAVVIALLLVYYSAKLKRTVLWGNLTVSVASAMTFIYGAVAVDDWRAGIIPAVFAFFFHFGRELVKDLQDLKGDLQHHAITFAGRFGAKASILLVNFLFAVLIVLTFVPYYLHIFNATYLWIAALGVDTVLLFTGIALWFKNDPATLGKFSHLLKLDMLVGLLAIYLGS